VYEECRAEESVTARQWQKNRKILQVQRNPLQAPPFAVRNNSVFCYGEAR